MTDELVKRLRSMHWCVTTETNGVGVSDRKVALEAADRIEALTADHNATLARLADAVVREINLTAERDKWKTAFDETCDAWQKQCEHEMNKTKAAEAERDIAVANLAALKGETP